MLLKRYTLLASAAIVAAFGSAASAGPITFNPTPFDSAEKNPITTTGGAGLISEYVDFNPAFTSTTAAGIFVTLTSFSPTGLPTGQDQINNRWQIYMEITNLVVTGSESGSTNSTEDFTSSSVTGTIDIYAQSGDTCSATPTSTGLGLSGCAGTHLATGTLESASTLDITGLGLNNSSETFSLVSALSSLSPDLLPAGDLNIDLTVNSGGTVNGTTSDSLFDAPHQDWCSGDGSCEATESVNWDVDAVPEPASLAIFGMGLVAVGFVRRRKRKAA
jgi:hypothetical protein